MKSNKADNSKKEKDKTKDKEKGKEKEKENKKNTKDEKQAKKEESDSEESYFTPEEIALLDKYHDLSGHKFEDQEIYEIMLKHKNNDDLVKNELNEMLKELKRGDEYGWTEIGKSKYIYIF
jgi:hypothetical protein